MVREHEELPSRYGSRDPDLELADLRHLVRHWLYKEGKRDRARPFVDRMDIIIRALPPNDDDIRFQECRALVPEVRGDLREAVRYREKEIAQWKKWFRIMGRPEVGWSRLRSDYEELADRHVRTAMLYEKLGEHDKAYEHLQKAKRLARKHGFELHHDDFLERLRKRIRQAKAGAAAAVRSAQNGGVSTSGSPPPRRGGKSARTTPSALPMLQEEPSAIPDIACDKDPIQPLVDEVWHWHEKVFHWWAEGKHWRARPFADKLEKALLALPPDDNCILWQECYALIHEVRLELRMAAEYREKEIALWEKWFRIMGPTDREGYEKTIADYHHLADRHICAAELYEKLRELEKAYAHMQKAKRLARKHGFDFSADSEDYLRQLRRRIRQKKG